MVKDQRYQWSMWLGIFLILFCSLFILKAGFDGRFHSVDTLQEYIRSFGLIGPLILIAIQAFKVVIPVLVQLYRDQSRLADRLYSGPALWRASGGIPLSAKELSGMDQTDSER